MSKRVRTNFILAMIPTVALGLIALLSIVLFIALLLFDERILGYLHFLGGLLMLMEFFAGGVFLVIALFLGGYVFLLFLFAMLAKQAYKRDGKGVSAYRILMGVEYLLQAQIIVFFIRAMETEFSAVYLIIAVLVAIGIIYSAINTYSKRILI